MSWESRSNGTYYYRKTRVGTRVVSEYVGTGEIASLAARLDELQARKRLYERFGIHLERAEVTKLYKTLDAVAREVNAVVAAYLVAEGYHAHKGEWRRRRGKQNE